MVIYSGWNKEHTVLRSDMVVTSDGGGRDERCGGGCGGCDERRCQKEGGREASIDLLYFLRLSSFSDSTRSVQI